MNKPAFIGFYFIYNKFVRVFGCYIYRPFFLGGDFSE
jgi:hypothetical protein